MTSEIIRGLETAWTALRQRHPDLPDMMISIVPRGIDDGGLIIANQLAIGSDRLAQGGRATFRALAHHAVHRLAIARHIDDVSNDGRYHNKAFATLAREIGLKPVGDRSRYGFASVQVPAKMARAYAEQIKNLDDLLDGYRPPLGRIDRRPRKSGATCKCEPPKHIWAERSTFERDIPAGAEPGEIGIRCEQCDSLFRLSVA